jgi:nitrite reductase/ring-hydroxylating ferredoxin subunit
MCAVEDLDIGDRIIREIGGSEVAVINASGEFVAVANYCVHAGGPICEGTLAGMITAEAGEWEWRWERDGEILACPWHGWEFDLHSGEFLSDPRYRLITYDVEIDDGTVFVVTGGSDADDEATTAKHDCD